MVFWIIALLSTALSALFLGWLFLRTLPEQADAQRLRIGRNVELYQQRLARLVDEQQKGFIDAAEYELGKTELARQLLRDVESLNVAPVQSRQRKKWLYLLLVPAPLLALLLYAAIGAWPDWQISRQLEALSQSSSMEQYRARFTDVQQAIVDRLEQRPDHVDYRLLLANSAMGQQNYNDAAMHYGILAELMPEDDEMLALYAQAEYLRSGRKITATVAQYMDKALRLNPENRTVLGMQGIHAIESGDFAGAVAAWQTLLNALPQDSQEAELIRQGIAAAKERLGESAVQQKQQEGIAVQVRLADNLSHLDSSLTVFVYARAANGPPMPLAARKLRVADLPASLRLDDASAMMPQMKLSDYEQVIIGARISMSGEPVARNGDWQGESAVINWREEKSVSLTIQEQVTR